MAKSSSKRRKPYTDADRQAARERADEKRERADELINGALDALTDPDVWVGYLTRAATLGRYSFRNQMLIGMQCPQATDVAGYVEWQGRGRQVREGEPGTMIFAPLTRTMVLEGDGKAVDRPALDGEQTVSKVRGLKLAYIWDISQTDPIAGKPFKPAAGVKATDLDAVRELIAEIAGEHAEAIIAALDAATGDTDDDADDYDDAELVSA